MSEEVAWRRLHPLSVAVNLLPRTWRVVRSLWPLFLAMLYGNRGGGEALLDIGFVGLFLAMTVGGTILHYLTLRYRVQDGRLEIRSGLINRQARVIAPDRVQNIERVRNVFHRLSGLVEVRIETASGTEVEGALSALSEADATELIDALGRGRPAAEDASVAPPPVVVENGPLELARYGLTSTRFGAALVVVGVGMELLERTDPQRIALGLGRLGTLGLVAAAVGLLTGTWLVGTGTVMIRHHGFRLSRHDEGLVAEEGLFTRRKVDLPIRKVQVVSIVEPWLRRMAGFGSVHIETAAARTEGGGTATAEAMVPVVERGSFEEVVRAAIPALDIPLATAPLRPPHPRALRRSLVRATVRGGLLAAGIGWWFWPWGLLGLLALPLAWATAWMDHRTQGWLLTDEVLIARRGYLSRRTRIVARSKLQSMHVVQGPFLRRAGLGELVVRVPGDAVTLPALEWDEARRLQLALLEPLPRARTGDAGALPVPAPPAT